MVVIINIVDERIPTNAAEAEYLYLLRTYLIPLKDTSRSIYADSTTIPGYSTITISPCISIFAFYNLSYKMILESNIFI